MKNPGLIGDLVLRSNRVGVCLTAFGILAILLTLAPGLISCGGGSGSPSKTSSGAGETVGPASGEYVWEAGSQANLYYASINATTGKLGAPTLAGIPADSISNYPSIVVAPSDNFLYAFWQSFNELETFQMSGPGVELTWLDKPNFRKNLHYEDSMTMHPSGKFLYVFSDSQGTIQEISVNTVSGALALGNVVKDNADIRLGVIDPAGRFLFVNDLSGGRIFVYQINSANGGLTPVPGSPFSLPSNELPAYLAIGGSGTSLFLYASLSQSSVHPGGIAAFAIDSSSGALTLVPGSPFQSGSDTPGYISVDPSGRFLYSAGLQDGSIYGFAIDSTTGALSLVPGSPFTAAFPSGTIAVDPSGKFLYVTNEKNSTIYGFTLDSATGSLSPLAGSPFPAVPQADGLTMMNIP